MIDSENPNMPEDASASSYSADAPDAPPPGRPSLVDSVAELVQMLVDYVRQETGDVVRDKVVLPTQKVGQLLAFAMAAAMTLVLGIAFLAVGALVLLAQFIGWPYALFSIGGVLVIGAAGLTYAKWKRVQK
jgi:hypothetical protein